MPRLIAITALVLATASGAACSGGSDDAADGSEHRQARWEGMTWETIAYSGESRRFYNDLSIEILRCIAKGGPSCRHPYLDERTQLVTVRGGDMPFGWRYPDGLADLAESLSPFERFEIGEPVSFPVPVNPRDPARAAVTLIHDERTTQVVVRFTYHEGHLDHAHFDWVPVRRGML